MAKFRDVPLGGCFSIGKSKALHKKNGDSTYIDDSVGEEITLSGTAKVRPAKNCPVPKTLIELGSARKKRS